MKTIKITTQDGSLIFVEEITMQGCVILGTLHGKPNEHMVCGKYCDRLRTTEVFSEMTCAGWNFENPEYVMPQN